MEPIFAALNMNFFEYLLYIMPQLWVGISNTIKVYSVAILPVLPLGVLLAIIKVAAPKPLGALIGVYTWAWRGMPLLLQLTIMKFGLPYLGIKPPDFLGAAFVFTLNMAAYITEIMRAAIQSVDKGQYEACRALGIPYWRMMLKIIIPQSIRIAIPPACSEAINLIKDVALIFVIGQQDILRVANQLASRDKSIIPYVVACITYLLLSSLLVKLFGLLEKKYTAYD